MDPAVADLLEASRAQPGSAALQRMLMRQPQAARVPEIADHLAASDPAAHDDVHRLRVAAFLTDSGRADAAQRWTPQPDADDSKAEPQGGAVVRLLPFRKSEQPVQPPAPVPSSALTFNDVGGLDHVKQQIRRKIITPFEKPGLFAAFRKRSGGGVLMYGPPGCGKTMLARATAGEANAQFISVAVTDVLSKWLGDSEQKLAGAFTQARTRKPAVLFFDELEALASRRRTSGDAGATVVSTFLSEMDGFASNNEGVLILAATNTPWAVDAAFRRPGRFDRVLFVPPPDQPARLAILASLLDGRPLAKGLDLQRIATATSGFSGADLANLVDTTTELAIEDSAGPNDLTPISRQHLDAAMKDVRPTTGEWLTSARNYAKYANENGIYDDVLNFIEKHTK